MQDTPYTDPEALRKLYLNPRNPLGGLAETDPAPATSTAPPDIEPPPPSGCPYIGDWTWKYIGSKRTKLTHVSIAALRQRVDALYNPITKRFNLITRLEIVEDVECLKVVTADNAGQLVSYSHPVIQSFKDPDGTAAETLRERLIAGRVRGIGAVSCLDTIARRTKLAWIEPAGKLTVAKITLEEEFIFASGTSPSAMICGHNKPPREGDPGGQG